MRLALFHCSTRTEFRFQPFFTLFDFHQKNIGHQANVYLLFYQINIVMSIKYAEFIERFSYVCAANTVEYIPNAH